MISETAKTHFINNTDNLLLAQEGLSAYEKEAVTLIAFIKEIAITDHKNQLTGAINRTLLQTSLIKKYYISIFNTEKTSLSTYISDFGVGFANLPQLEILSSVTTLNDSLINRVLKSSDPIVLDVDRLIRSGQTQSYVQFWKKSGLKTIVATNLIFGGEVLGIIWIQPKLISGNLLKAICTPIAASVFNILAKQKISKQSQEINDLKRHIINESSMLQANSQRIVNYGEILGGCEAMKAVYLLVSKVAKTQSSVLIMGETGTGKELIAKALHYGSNRKDKAMIKINCAALPPNLIESELFGHEKGSFTGATERRIGKFELANKGTLFLDEVGELPLELQVKLLRALQEKEIERVGGQSIIKTDVRIIAATNRDLLQEVQNGNFRSDLYFRLNIFPIIVPPLRKRKEDIVILATHFLQKYTPKNIKKIPVLSCKVIKQLTSYSWPGNVRELEHLMERSIVLMPGSVINQISLPDITKKNIAGSIIIGYIKTIDEVEREHIIMVLKQCNGKVAGIGGAAEVLKIPSTTLNSKIRRLNIKKEHRLK